MFTWPEGTSGHQGDQKTTNETAGPLDKSHRRKLAGHACQLFLTDVVDLVRATPAPVDQTPLGRLTGCLARWNL